jgi:tungstate transport system substrate-binding protein
VRHAASALLLALAACGRPPLHLGATFTLEQSGALIAIDSLYPGRHFATITGPSGQMLRMAAAGDLDVVIAHAPALERRLLVQPGLVERACPLFASRFGIAGPAADPAGIRGAATGLEAMRRIARTGAVFVSRGDSSGTHQKERELWTAVGLDPDGELWHVESGASQAANIIQAAHWRGYTLVDVPTFTLMKSRRGDALELELLVAPPADTMLANPYTLYLVRTPTPHPDAAALADWLATSWRDRVAEMRLPDGGEAFAQPEGGCSAD